MTRNQKIIAAAIAILLAIWLVWPSATITNEDSTGTAIVAFGDSITAGYGAAEADSYPAKLAGLIQHEVLNAGVSGDTTEAALARLDEDVLSKHPRIVIVGLGGNDFLRGVPIATTEANLRNIIEQVQARGAMVVLLGFEFPSFTANYADLYERIADDEGCLLIEDVLDGILNDPKLKSDEIHPNAAGYALIAERVAGPLRKLQRRTGSET